jgi:hypothetical protein
MFAEPTHTLLRVAAQFGGQGIGPRRRLAALLVAVVSLTLVLAPGQATAKAPASTVYSGQSSGTTSAQIKIKVARRHHALHVTLLGLSDGCASGFVQPPVGLGQLHQSSFHRMFSGSTTSVGWALTFDGVFTNPRRGSVTVHGAVGDLFPAPGIPPGSANICEDTSTFQLSRLPRDPSVTASATIRSDERTGVRYTGCGDTQDLGKLSVVAVKCPKARRVIKHFLHHLSDQGTDQSILGFDCAEMQPANLMHVRCNKGEQRIAWVGVVD